MNFLVKMKNCIIFSIQLEIYWNILLVVRVTIEMKKWRSKSSLLFYSCFITYWGYIHWKLRCFNAFLRPLINIDSMDEIIHHKPNRYHISLYIHWTLHSLKIPVDGSKKSYKHLLKIIWLFEFKRINYDCLFSLIIYKCICNIGRWNKNEGGIEKIQETILI